MCNVKGILFPTPAIGKYLVIHFGGTVAVGMYTQHTVCGTSLFEINLPFCFG